MPNAHGSDRAPLSRSAHFLWRWLRGALLVSALAGIWIISYFLASLSIPFSFVTGPQPEWDDLMTLLFGASSVALFMVSSVFAILSLIGWQNIKERLARVDSLEKEVREQLNGFEAQMKARVLSILGYALGEMSMSRTQRVTNRERLAEAIQNCQTAFDFLKDFRGEPVEYMALNNLIFYSTFEDDSLKKDFILHEARRLLSAAQSRQYINFILTACRAISKFSADKDELKSIAGILEVIRDSPKTSDREKREARLYLASLSKSAAS